MASRPRRELGMVHGAYDGCRMGACTGVYMGAYAGGYMGARLSILTRLLNMLPVIVQF